MSCWGLDEWSHPLAPVFMMRDDGPDTETLKTDDAGSLRCNEASGGCYNVTVLK